MIHRYTGSRWGIPHKKRHTTYFVIDDKLGYLTVKVLPHFFYQDRLSKKDLQEMIKALNYANNLDKELNNFKTKKRR